MYKLYYESATRGKHIIAEGGNLQEIESVALNAFTYLTILKKSNFIRSVVCVRCYEDDNDKPLFQYGSI